jgi:hypothetical protein
MLGRKGHIISAFVLMLICTMAYGQEQKPAPPMKQYSIEQATSEWAQLHTMAFSGLAFLTGSFGADCFFPPGKVADFFGFQYMRDNDKNQLGHNTDFLTRIANNVISIMNPEQMQKLISLANKQAAVYDSFAIKRMVLIKAFRESLNGNKTLNKKAVIHFTASLYELDAELSYDRALLYSDIAASLSDEQKARLSKLDFKNSQTWPILEETLDKRSLTHRAHVCVMTYASEFFSWYAGSEIADTYFCPERHGTYFGGFYLKDYPAMGNKGYSISTKLTGDKGKEFIDVLSIEQASCLQKIVEETKPILKEIVKNRELVSKEFRRGLNQAKPDKEKVFSMIKRYGELDGELSYYYASCFASIFKTLSDKQMKQLNQIRNLDILPHGTYLFSDPIEIPKEINCSELFD